MELRMNKLVREQVCWDADWIGIFWGNLAKWKGRLNLFNGKLVRVDLYGIAPKFKWVGGVKSALIKIEGLSVESVSVCHRQEWMVKDYETPY